ncbi:MAG: YfhO family protein, partial [Candidatus Latescibacterota bacterium]|nr:YfhO family protein [Candidatus Latescibacterota bacterium]
MSAAKYDLGAVGLIGAAVVACFWPAATMQGAFFVQDVMVQNYPFREFFARAINQGQLPLWNAAINCGFPLFAEGQAGALYPPNIVLALLLPAWAALNLNVVIHLWLAGVGIYGLLRSFGASWAAGLCAGLCYALSGYMVVRAMSPNFIAVCAWVPVLFYLIERSLARRRWLDLLLFATVVCLQLLAGHPQATAYGLVAVIAYGSFRTWSHSAGWKFFAALVAAPILGVGLAAVQILPTAELVQLSNRGSGLSWEHFVAMSLPPERLITLLLPNFFGNSAHGTYWSRELGFFIQLCAYVGVLPLVCAWVALRERRDAPTGFFAALALVGLVLALGKYTAIFSLLYEMPGLSFFRIPTRFLLWFALGTSVLCGLGVDRLLQTDGNKRTNGLLLVVFMGLAALGLIYANGVQLISVGVGEQLTRYTHHLRSDVLRLVLALGLGAWLLGRRARGFAGWVAPLAIFAELYSFGTDFNRTIDPTVYTQTPATARAIAADRGDSQVPARILSLISERTSPFDWHGGWAYDLASYRRYPETLRMYAGGPYGLANALPGWSPLHLYRHGEFARGYPAFAALAGIEYAVRYGGGGGLELVCEGDIGVYRFAETLPRAYMVGKYRVEAARRRRLAYLMGGEFSKHREVVLEKNPTTEIGAGGRVRILRYEDEKVEIGLENHAGGILVLSDTYYPGWKSYIDGIAVPILRANHVFRAVVVPAGAEQVVFSYQPDSFRNGMLISAATALLC